MFMAWFCTEINIVILILYTNSRVVSLLSVGAVWESPRGGELSLSACQRVGNGPPSEKKMASPRGYGNR